MEVSLSAGNNPMALLFKTALEGVNKALAGELGPDAIQKSYASGLDVSPQATADRIVQLSTAFFGQYQAKHPEQSTEDALHSFTTLIGGGIDKGFKEARDILEGLNVLKEGNIGSNIDATYELVQKGLNVSLTIIGEGSERLALETLIHQYRLEKYILLLGSKNAQEIRNELQAHDIYLLLAVPVDFERRESQGLATIEAQACGLPAIVFDSGGVKYTVQNEYSGFISKAKNVSF